VYISVVDFKAYDTQAQSAKEAMDECCGNIQSEQDSQQSESAEAALLWLV
jgi:hypothetical protein